MVRRSPPDRGTRCSRSGRKRVTHTAVRVHSHLPRCLLLPLLSHPSCEPSVYADVLALLPAHRPYSHTPPNASRKSLSITFLALTSPLHTQPATQTPTHTDYHRVAGRTSETPNRVEQPERKRAGGRTVEGIGALCRTHSRSLLPSGIVAARRPVLFACNLSSPPIAILPFSK
jgi:hypothetical protein